MSIKDSFQFQIDARIGSFQTLPNGKIRMSSIGDLFQEIAWQHADSGGFGIKLMDSNQMWALVRFDIEVIKMPSWGDQVKLFTAGRGVNKIFAFREFLMLSKENEILVKGMSSWLLLDSKSKRPTRPADSLPPELFDPSVVPSWEPHKIKVKGELILTQKIQVRFSDLDLNNHVNNTSYIRWIEDILLENNFESTSYSLNYLAEAHLKDWVTINVFKTSSKLFIKGESEDKSIFLAEVSTAILAS